MEGDLTSVFVLYFSILLGLSEAKPGIKDPNGIHNEGSKSENAMSINGPAGLSNTDKIIILALLGAMIVVIVILVVHICLSCCKKRKSRTRQPRRLQSQLSVSKLNSRYKNNSNNASPASPDANDFPMATNNGFVNRLFPYGDPETPSFRSSEESDPRLHPSNSTKTFTGLQRQVSQGQSRGLPRTHFDALDDDSRETRPKVISRNNSRVSFHDDSPLMFNRSYSYN